MVTALPPSPPSPPPPSPPAICNAWHGPCIYKDCNQQNDICTGGKYQGMKSHQICGPLNNTIREKVVPAIQTGLLLPSRSFLQITMARDPLKGEILGM